MTSKWDSLNLTEQCKAVREMGDKISHHGFSPNMETAQRLCEIGLDPNSAEVQNFRNGNISIDDIKPAAAKPVAAPPVISDGQRSIKEAIEMAKEYNSTNPLIPRTWHFYAI